VPVADAFPGDLPVDLEFGSAPGGREWLDGLPALVAELESR
jgi:hypothetical protein